MKLALIIGIAISATVVGEWWLLDRLMTMQAEYAPLFIFGTSTGMIGVVVGVKLSSWADRSR